MATPLEGKVSLIEGMTFDAVSGSGHTVRVDAAREVGGQDQGPRPMELVLLALGGCTGMDVISILRKMRQDVTGYEVNVSGDRTDEHPRVYTHVTVEHVVRGRDVSEDAVRKAVDLSERRYCPISAMLSKATTVEHRFRVIEE